MVDERVDKSGKFILYNLITKGLDEMTGNVDGDGRNETISLGTTKEQIFIIVFGKILIKLLEL